MPEAARSERPHRGGGAGRADAGRPPWPARSWRIGGLLLAGAGAETLPAGTRWPALGDAFRAPPDRAQPPAGQDEPPWEGD